VCVALEYLEMRDNFFQGSIPETLVNLRSIEEIDISKNRLSRNIPDFFKNLSYLHLLNLSFNSLVEQFQVVVFLEMLMQFQLKEMMNCVQEF
jgi:Leucine-rich repeat (LRR) protein